MARTEDVGKAGSGDPGGPVQLRCSVPGGRTSHGAGSMQTSEERGYGPSPWQTATWKVLSPDGRSTLHFILNSHKLFSPLLINMCCFKMRRVYTASLSNALCSPGFSPLRLI